MLGLCRSSGHRHGSCILSTHTAHSRCPWKLRIYIVKMSSSIHHLFTHNFLKVIGRLSVFSVCQHAFCLSVCLFVSVTLCLSVRKKGVHLVQACCINRSVQNISFCGTWTRFSSAFAALSYNQKTKKRPPINWFHQPSRRCASSTS